MIICHPAERRGPLLVTFRVNDAELQDRRISVVGDFNDWDRTANLLWEQPGGTHSLTLALHPGRYRFRYVTEHGRWFDDDTAHGYEQNGFGQRNCLLDLAVEPAADRGVLAGH
jgi:1,4-alpha-glucan branching enzyme